MNTDTQPENPPAFPVCNENAPSHLSGASLRDYFAAAALPNIAEMTIREAANQRKPQVDETPTIIANVCYRIADAMLAARAKQGGDQ